MTTVYHRVTIVRMQKPRVHTLNDDLQWLGISLGLFNLRDKDKSCFRIFIELLKSAAKNEELTSDELAERVDLSRGTVVHHLHKLEESGLVINNRNRYVLRDANLAEVIANLEKDLQRTLFDLKQMAHLIDDELGLTEQRDSRTVL